MSDDYGGAYGEAGYGELRESSDAPSEVWTIDAEDRTVRVAAEDRAVAVSAGGA